MISDTEACYIEDLPDKNEVMFFDLTEGKRIKPIMSNVITGFQLF